MQQKNLPNVIERMSIEEAEWTREDRQTAGRAMETDKETRKAVVISATLWPCVSPRNIDHLVKGR